MDGQKLLRNLLFTSLTGACLSGPLATDRMFSHRLLADDYIRPPAKAKASQPVASSTIRQPDSKPTVQPVNPTTANLELDAPQVPPAVLSQSVVPPKSAPIPSPVPPAQAVANTPTAPLQWQPRGTSQQANSATSNGSYPRESKSHALNATGQMTENSVFSSAGRVSAQVTSYPSQTRVASGTEVQLVAEPTEMVDPVQQHRFEQAQRLSRELTTPPVYQGTSIAAVEPSSGWQAIGEQLKVHVEKCEQLLSRRAYLSAIEEANQGVLRLARALDIRESQFVSEPAWAAAQQAFREAQDFTRIDGLASDLELMRRLINSHETPVLHGANVQELTPLSAAQHYQAHAERCLHVASQNHPWFCELYYCLGRAKQSQAEAGDSKADTLMLQALSYYRAAQAVDPANATNSNQLGYLLLRLDRPNEAMLQLQQTVQLAGCPLETWQNLIQASSRLGDKQTEKWAYDNFMTLKNQGAQPSGPVNTLVQVTPEQFMALSPRGVGPSVNMPGSIGQGFPGNTSDPNSTNAGGPAGYGPNAAAQQSLPAGSTDRTATNPLMRIFR